MVICHGGKSHYFGAHKNRQTLGVHLLRCPPTEMSIFRGYLGKQQHFYTNQSYRSFSGKHHHHLLPKKKLETVRNIPFGINIKTKPPKTCPGSPWHLPSLTRDETALSTLHWEAIGWMLDKLAASWKHNEHTWNSMVFAVPSRILSFFL